MKKILFGDFVLFFMAIVLTYFMVVTGFDWGYFQFVKQYSWLTVVFNPALVIGMLLPLILFVVIVAFYWKFRARSWMQQLIKVFLAMVCGIVIDSILKAFTGRPAPVQAVGLVDNSRIFLFGFLRGGIFWGWPSEHALVAFAMATTFAKLNSKKLSWVIAAYVYAFYIAVGVSLRIHWLSDVVAGAFIGYAIGQTIIKKKQLL